MKSVHFPKTDVPEADIRVRWYRVALVLIFLTSLWLRAAFPITAFGTAIHDDMLFVKMAASIGQGQWLGSYDNLTHAKGVGYSLFLLANHVTGLPLKISEHLLYLLAALYLSGTLGRVCASRWATLAAFALLAFVPTAWTPGAGGRVVREGLYVTLSLVLLAMSVRCFVEGRRASIVDETREKWRLLVLLGLTAGWYWLTREEGVWLAPSVAILCGYWIWSRRKAPRAWPRAVLFLALPLISAGLVIGSVNSINYFKYGVFRNNDFRSSDFQAGYGALSRIKHDHWRPYVVFPRDARERAYRFSAAARELRPMFEGAVGETWRSIGCNQMEVKDCPEILSGWFMWALRDAVSVAGHYRSAEAASAFYRRLAAEIDAACEQNPGECLPYRETMVPPWRDRYLSDTVNASWEVFKTLITMHGTFAGVSPSVGTPKQLAAFALATNGPLAPTVQPGGAEDQSVPKLVSPRDTVRFELARRLAQIESTFSKFSVPAAIVGLLIWCGWALRRRRLDAALVVALALVAAVGARVVLLGFLEATSIPSNNMLYLMPVLPMALALVPAVLFGLLAYAKKKND